MKKLLTNKWTWIVLAIIAIAYFTRNKWMPLIGLTTASSAKNINPCVKGKIYTISGQQYQCCGQDASGNNLYYPVSTGGCSGPAIGVIKGGIY